jgi:predicted nucleic acid-binding protein
MSDLPPTAVDTAAWIDWFVRGGPRLDALLRAGRVAVHPWAVYELELGSGIPGEDRALVAQLPRVDPVSDQDAWALGRLLRGVGLGWVDVHMLAATSAAGFALMTNDQPLAQAAARLGVDVSANEPVGRRRRR